LQRISSVSGWGKNPVFFQRTVDFAEMAVIEKGECKITLGPMASDPQKQKRFFSTACDRVSAPGTLAVPRVLRKRQ